MLLCVCWFGKCIASLNYMLLTVLCFKLYFLLYVVLFWARRMWGDSAYFCKPCRLKLLNSKLQSFWKPLSWNLSFCPSCHNIENSIQEHWSALLALATCTFRCEMLKRAERMQIMHGACSCSLRVQIMQIKLKWHYANYANYAWIVFVFVNSADYANYAEMKLCKLCNIFKLCKLIKLCKNRFAHCARV